MRSVLCFSPALVIGVAITVYLFGVLWFGPIAGGTVSVDGIATLTLIGGFTTLIVVSFPIVQLLCAAKGFSPKQRLFYWRAVFTVALLASASAYAAETVSGRAFEVDMQHPDGTWHHERFGAQTAIFVLSAGLTLVSLALTRLRVPGDVRCSQCGFDLRGTLSADIHRCPECGGLLSRHGN